MAHIRDRYIKDRLLKLTKFSPLIGIMGHRQVGKTTLLERISSQYISLDDPDHREQATQDPKSFLQKNSKQLTSIDECQLAPELFPVFKEHVRRSKRPGQYILSGSIRFTSKKSIQESLTGRIVNVELLPFSITELLEQPLSSFMPDLIRTKNLDHFASTINLSKSKMNILRKHSEVYFQQGGLPGLCFIRDQKLKSERLETQLQTLLERDLKTITNTKLNYPELRRICIEIAKNQGMPIQIEKLKVATKASYLTIKSVLYALESIFLIRKIPIMGTQGKETYFFEDMAESRHLLGKSNQDWIHLLFCNLRTQFEYLSGEPYQIFQYRTRSNVVVPLAFTLENSHCGIIFTKAEKPNNIEMSAARSFLQAFDQSKVLMLHQGSQINVIHPRIISVPVYIAL